MKKILEKKHSKKTMPLAIEKIRKHFFCVFSCFSRKQNRASRQKCVFFLSKSMSLTKAKSCLSRKSRIFSFPRGTIVPLAKAKSCLWLKQNHTYHGSKAVPLTKTKPCLSRGTIVTLAKAKPCLSRKQFKNAYFWEFLFEFFVRMLRKTGEKTIHKKIRKNNL